MDIHTRFAVQLNGGFHNPRGEFIIRNFNVPHPIEPAWFRETSGHHGYRDEQPIKSFTT